MSEDRFEPQHQTERSAFVMTPAWTWPPFHNLDELVKTINVFKTKKVPEPTTSRRPYGIPGGGCHGGAEVGGRRTIDMLVVRDTVARLIIRSIHR